MVQNPAPETLASTCPVDGQRSAEFYKLRWRGRGPAASLAKRAVDVIGAVCGLFLFGPLMILIAIIIKSDGGPALFSHGRIGRNGKEFDCLKFRSMVVDAEDRMAHILRHNPGARREWEQGHKLTDDPRVTAFGRFLRVTSLDELPQFLNVLRGEMSLIGPRPITETEISRYGEHFEDYARCRPGMSGMWQVSGRNGIDYRQRVRLDSAYANQWSLWLDATILLRTFFVVAKGTGAH